MIEYIEDRTTNKVIYKNVNAVTNLFILNKISTQHKNTIDEKQKALVLPYSQFCPITTVLVVIVLRPFKIKR